MAKNIDPNTPLREAPETIGAALANILSAQRMLDSNMANMRKEQLGTWNKVAQTLDDERASSRSQNRAISALALRLDAQHAILLRMARALDDQVAIATLNELASLDAQILSELSTKD